MPSLLYIIIVLFKESWLLRGNRSILFLFLSNFHFIPGKAFVYLLRFVMAEFVQPALGYLFVSVRLDVCMSVCACVCVSCDFS